MPRPRRLSVGSGNVQRRCAHGLLCQPRSGKRTASRCGRLELGDLDPVDLVQRELEEALAEPLNRSRPRWSGSDSRPRVVGRSRSLPGRCSMTSRGGSSSAAGRASRRGRRRAGEWSISGCATEDHRVHLGLLQRPRVTSTAAVVSAPKAWASINGTSPDRRATAPASMDQLLVAPPAVTVASVAIRPMRRFQVTRTAAWSADHTHHRNGDPLLEIWQCREAAELRDEDSGFIALREVRRSRARSGGPRRAAADRRHARHRRDTVSVRPTTGIRAGRQLISCRSRKTPTGRESSGDEGASNVVHPSSPWVADFSCFVAVFFVFPASAAHAFTKTITIIDGRRAWPLAATLYAPDGAPPQGATGGSRAPRPRTELRSVMNAVAEAHSSRRTATSSSPWTRAHGASGGQFSCSVRGGRRLRRRAPVAALSSPEAAT